MSSTLCAYDDWTDFDGEFIVEGEEEQIMLDTEKTPAQTAGSKKNESAPTEVVPQKAKKRRFTVAYKLRILEEADGCTEPGSVGALLRREGLYSSHLSTWRRLRNQGQLMDTNAKARGRKPLPPEIKEELELLRKQNRQLQQRLAKAETIIEVQKKVSSLLGLNNPSTEQS